MAFPWATYEFLETAQESHTLVRRFDLTPAPYPESIVSDFPDAVASEEEGTGQ
jgi:hypothetical protein